MTFEVTNVTDGEEQSVILLHFFYCLICLLKYKSIYKSASSGHQGSVLLRCFHANMDLLAWYLMEQFKFALQMFDGIRMD